MIIDYRTDPDHARRFSVVDQPTGKCLDHMHIFYANESDGLVRYYETNPDGQPYLKNGSIANGYFQGFIVILPRITPEIPPGWATRSTVILPRATVAASKGQVDEQVPA
jgi:hypothetical protein